MVVAQGMGNGVNEDMLVKGYKLLVIRQISSRDVMYNVIIINIAYAIYKS